MPEYVLGINTDEFKPDNNGQYYNNFLYYGTGKLTDDNYIKNVYLKTPEGFVNKGKHTVYVVGKVEPGDYLTTCYIKGVAVPSTTAPGCFAKVLKGSVAPYDRESDIILKAYVEFL